MDAQFTPYEIATWMRVGPQVVWRWIRSGDLSASQQGRFYWVTRTDLLAFIDYSHQENAMVAQSDLPPLYTFEEIAETYGLSLRGMHDDARARKFSYVRRGKAWRMTAEQLKAFLALHTEHAAVAPDPLAEVRERHERNVRRARKATAAAA